MRGKPIVKDEPRSFPSLAAVSIPPCKSTIALEIARPEQELPNLIDIFLGEFGEGQSVPGINPPDVTRLSRSLPGGDGGVDCSIRFGVIEGFVLEQDQHHRAVQPRENVDG